MHFLFSLCWKIYISQRVFVGSKKSYKSHIRSCINKIQQSLLLACAHRRPLKKLIICESHDLIYKSWISWSDAFREELLSVEFIPSILPHKTYFHWIESLKHLCRNYTSPASSPSRRITLKFQKQKWHYLVKTPQSCALSIKWIFVARAKSDQNNSDMESPKVSLGFCAHFK